MNELADVARDQGRHRRRGQPDLRVVRREGRRGRPRPTAASRQKAGALLEKLRRRLRDINEAGLTPFAKRSSTSSSAGWPTSSAWSATATSRGARHGAPGQAEPRHHRRRARGRDQRRSEIEVGRRDPGRARRRAAHPPGRQGADRRAPVAVAQARAIMGADDRRAIDRLRAREAQARTAPAACPTAPRRWAASCPATPAPSSGKKAPAARSTR